MIIGQVLALAIAMIVHAYVDTEKSWCRHVRVTLWFAVVAVLCGCLVTVSSASAQVPHKAKQYQRILTREAHRQWGLSAPIPVFAAQIHQESAWNRWAVSRTGARGLTQFMPATASWWCERTGVSVRDCQPHNATWAIRSMVGYDRFLYQHTPHRYSTFDRLWVALRSYNGGLGHWRREAKATGLQRPTRVQVDAACGRARRHRSHCKENLGYPRRILITLQPRYAAWGQLWRESDD